MSIQIGQSAIEVEQDSNGTTTLSLVGKYGDAHSLTLNREQRDALVAELTAPTDHPTGPKEPNMLDAVHSKVTDIIEQALADHTQFRVRERAKGAADDLRWAGLLVGDDPRIGSGTVQQRVAATLQCRYRWSFAEQITASLVEAGLLREDHPEFDFPR